MSCDEALNKSSDSSWELFSCRFCLMTRRTSAFRIMFIHKWREVWSNRQRNIGVHLGVLLIGYSTETEWKYIQYDEHSYLFTIIKKHWRTNRYILRHTLKCQFRMQLTKPLLLSWWPNCKYKKGNDFEIVSTNTYNAIGAM